MMFQPSSHAFITLLQRNSLASGPPPPWDTRSSLTEDRTTKTQPPPTCQHDTIELPAAADDEEQKEIVAGHGDP